MSPTGQGDPGDATPAGVEEIRIPSQRAFRERERRRAEGILVDRAVIAALEAL
jgi:LDH2 family malate/lactate/ureidoglycolate dehydrogenase